MTDELRSEYAFDYSKAKPNRFAAGITKGGRMVILDPEVAEALGDRDINAVLKDFLKTVPSRSTPGPSTATA